MESLLEEIFMVFSSLLFLFRFLPAVLLLYFLSPRVLKNTGAVCDEPYFLCLGRAGICHIDAFFHGCGLYARSACFPLYGCRASGQSQMDRYFIDYN